METLLGAAFFGIASFVGILLGGTISAQPFHDGPAPAEPPVAWIVGASALIGGAVAYTGNTHHLVIQAIVICALAAIWCTDIRYGIVPDVFTIVPLALVLAVSLFERQVWPFASAALAFVPFAGMALVSRGRGMGWGDVKLAALGGAVLGGETALLAFAASAILAALTAYLHGRPRDVIAFAPYLAGAIAVALPLATT